LKIEEELILIAKSLYDRGLTPGSSGNISIRYQDGFLITPTKSSLGRLKVEELAFVDSEGLYSEQTFPYISLCIQLIQTLCQ
jgi:3-dehydro-4-phosphotetronate decarboxylase